MASGWSWRDPKAKEEVQDIVEEVEEVRKVKVEAEVSR